LTSTLSTRAEYAAWSRTQLIAKVEELESELVKVQYQAVLYGSLASDIERLESELALRPLDAYTSARVLADSTASAYGTLIIDAGQTSGVTVNDYVTVHGVYVGRVISVDPHQSLVQLASSAGEVTTVSLEKSTLERTMRGVGGGYELDIPQSFNVSRGTLIREATLGLPMAQIVDVEIEPTNAVVTALAAPLAHNPLRTVSLIHAQAP
jgi:cell shape-determining protein MreC